MKPPFYHFAMPILGALIIPFTNKRGASPSDHLESPPLKPRAADGARRDLMGSAEAHAKPNAFLLLLLAVSIFFLSSFFSDDWGGKVASWEKYQSHGNSWNFSL